ncbi:MAG: hypothetical protein AB1846_11410 [Chloroflexota bacterium]
MRRRFRGGRLARPNPARQVPPALLRANQLFTGGDYRAAAAAFDELARRAEMRGGPNAGRFALRAGEAWVMAGDVQTGMARIKDGLNALIAAGNLAALGRIGPRVVRELTERGLTAEAEEVTGLLRQRLPGFSATPSAPGPVGRVTLPTHCPGCGAPLRPDEVEWLDAASAECDYCGSLIRPDR